MLQAEFLTQPELGAATWSSPPPDVTDVEAELEGLQNRL